MLLPQFNNRPGVKKLNPNVIKNPAVRKLNKVQKSMNRVKQTVKQKRRVPATPGMFSNIRSKVTQSVNKFR